MCHNPAPANATHSIRTWQPPLMRVQCIIRFGNNFNLCAFHYALRLFLYLYLYHANITQKRLSFDAEARIENQLWICSSSTRTNINKKQKLIITKKFAFWIIFRNFFCLSLAATRDVCQRILIYLNPSVNNMNEPFGWVFVWWHEQWIYMYISIYPGKFMYANLLITHSHKKLNHRFCKQMHKRCAANVSGTCRQGQQQY